MMEDQASECDSLEVIDMDAEISEAIAEAARDEKKVQEERVSVGGPMDKIPESFTTSQYAQVIFHDVRDSYANTNDVVCRYNITEGFLVANGDRIGLYRLPFLQPQEYIMFSWVQAVTEDGSGDVVFPAKDLPQEPDFYQFQYIKFDGTVAGASVPWHLTAAGGVQQEVGAEAEDLVMVQTPLSSLRLNNDVLAHKVKDIEEKYNSLMEMSEKLSEELTRKSASFVVLDARYKSLIEEKTQAEEVQADVATLIAEKLVLEQSLHKANESRHIAESEAEAMARKIAEFQGDLAEKNSELEQCEEARAAAEQGVERLRSQLSQMDQEMNLLRSERASINGMLDTELTRRESCLAENQHLLARLEDSNTMLQATQKSKEMAIKEIRGMVQTQDLLRRDLQQARICLSDRRDTIESLKMSKSSLEEEFVRTKDQLIELTRDGPKFSADNQDPAVQEVLASLGSKLEAAEQTIRDQAGHIKRLEAELETARQTLDQQSETEYINWQNGQLKDKMEELTGTMTTREKEHEEQLGALQQENINLKQRLQVGAEHYKKLALEKTRPVSCDCQTYQEKIKELTEEVRSLRGEMQDGREETRLSLAHLKEVVVSEQQSLASAPSSTYSGDSNMDSIRINSCMETGARPRHPAFLQSAPKFVEAGSLPQPLEPENLDPYTAIRSGQNSHTEEAAAGENSGKIVARCFVCNADFSPLEVHECAGYEREREDQLQKCLICNTAFNANSTHKCAAAAATSRDQLTQCPICDQKFEEGITEAKITEHVENHFGRECPFCYKILESVDLLELHVQTHLRPDQREEVSPLRRDSLLDF